MFETENAASVSVGLIRILWSYAAGVGVDFNVVTETARLDPSILEDSEARVSAKYFESMWNKTLSLSNDPFPGLHFGQEMARHSPGGNILFTMMMNCANVGLALDTFIRYHRIMADAIQPQLIKDGSLVRLSWSIPGTGLASHPHLSEALLCTYRSILEHLSEGRLHPVKVCFTHSSPNDLSEYNHVFRCPLAFEAEKNELLIEAASLDNEIHLANQELFKVIEKYAARLASTIGKEQTWSNRVLSLISEMFGKGTKPDIDSVSKKLGASRRNLQEKLKDEKRSFRNCLEMVRKQMALDYLIQPNITICDVAFLLGYSEQSAFNHAFKRWTGKTPKEYRIEKQAQSPVPG